MDAAANANAAMQPPAAPSVPMAVEPTTAAVTDAPTTGAANTNAVSPEAYESIKKQLADRDEQFAQMSARMQALESKEREQLSKMTPVIDQGMDILVEEAKSKEDTEAVKDYGIVKDYLNQLANRPGPIEETRPLARTVHAFSQLAQTAKRSAGSISEDRDALKAAHEENEKLRTELDSVNKRHKEAVDLGNERRDANISLQNKLAEAGLVRTKYDFSLQSNRESGGSSSAAPAAPLDPFQSFVDEVRRNGNPSRFLSNDDKGILQRLQPGGAPDNGAGVGLY